MVISVLIVDIDMIEDHHGRVALFFFPCFGIDARLSAVFGAG